MFPSTPPSVGTDQVVLRPGEESADSGLEEDDPGQDENDRAELPLQARPDEEADHGNERGAQEQARHELPLVAAEVVVRPPADPDLRDQNRQQRSRQGEQDARDHSRTALGGEHLLPHRSREERERDRPVPVFGRRDEDADQGREEERNPARRRDVPAEIRRKHGIVQRGVDSRDRSDQDDGELREQDPEQGPGSGPDFQELRSDQAHYVASSWDVKSRNACSSDELSATSSCRTIPLAAAISPT